MLRLGKDGAYPEDMDFVPASVIVGVGAAAGGGGIRTVLVVLANEVGGDFTARPRVHEQRWREGLLRAYTYHSNT